MRNLVILLSSCCPLFLSSFLFLFLSSCCPSFVPLLSSSCPPLVLFLSFSCPPLVLLLPFSRPPLVVVVAAGQTCVLLLSSRCPLVLLLTPFYPFAGLQMAPWQHEGAPPPSAIKRSNARKQLRNRKPCVALSGFSRCVRVVFFPSSFCPCCPPRVLLWSFCCPAAVPLFTLLSESAAAHNNNSCRLSCLGFILV